MESKREHTAEITGKQAIARLLRLSELLDKIATEENLADIVMTKRGGLKNATPEAYKAYLANVCNNLNKDVLKRYIRVYFHHVLQPRTDHDAEEKAFLAGFDSKIVSLVNALLAEFSLRKQIVLSPEEYFKGKTDFWYSPVIEKNNTNFFDAAQLKVEAKRIDAVLNILLEPIDDKIVDQQATKQRVDAFDLPPIAYRHTEDAEVIWQRLSDRGMRKLDTDRAQIVSEALTWIDGMRINFTNDAARIALTGLCRQIVGPSCPGVELVGRKALEIEKEQKALIPDIKDFVVHLFERGLEVRTGIKAVSLTKKKNLQALKNSAERLETPKSVEMLAHQIEIKIAEWEKKHNKQGYKDVIEGKDEKKKETFARDKNAKQKNTYIKFLSMAKDKLDTARMALIDIKMARLSDEKERAQFIAAKVNEYKEEIRDLLVKKGELMSLPQDVSGASVFKRLFPRKIVDEAKVNEYFENSTYGVYLKKLGLQESQLIAQKRG